MISSSQMKTNVALELSATWNQHVRTLWEILTARVMKDTLEMVQTAQVCIFFLVQSTCMVRYSVVG